MNTDNVNTIQLAKVRGFPLGEVEHIVREKDVILYHLTVGVSSTQEAALKTFLLNSGPPFSVLPSLTSELAYLVLDGIVTGGLTELGINIKPNTPMNVFHSSEYLEPIFPGKVKVKASVVDILDKGKAAVVVSRVEIRDAASDRLLSREESRMWVPGAGGFGGNRNIPGVENPPVTPTSSPDVTVTEKISNDQAILFAYAAKHGKPNRLHLDLDFCKTLGYHAPIVQGNLVYGIMVRQVIQMFCNSDSTKVKKSNMSFLGVVFPGDTLQCSFWVKTHQIHALYQVGDRKCATGCVYLKPTNLKPVHKL